MRPALGRINIPGRIVQNGSSFLFDQGRGRRRRQHSSRWPRRPSRRNAPKITWRLTSSFPKSLDTIYGAAETMSKYVSEATDGKFHIQVFPAGEIVPGLEAADAVSAGTVEVCHTASYYYWGKDPTYAFGTAVPFGLNCRQQNAWMYYGGGIDLMNEFYATQNLHRLPCGNTGAQMGGWFRKEIKTVADLQGLKMRIGGFAGKVIEQARRGAAADRRRRHLSVAGEGHDRRRRMGRPLRRREARLLQGRAVLLLSRLVGRRRRRCTTWSTRPNGTSCRRAYQAIVKAACQAANCDMQANYDSQNPTALKQLVANGAQLRPFPQDVLEACFNAAKETYAEIVGTERRPSRRSTTARWRSAPSLSLVAGLRIHLRHLHDGPAAGRQALSRVGRIREGPGSDPGPFRLSGSVESPVCGRLTRPVRRAVGAPSRRCARRRQPRRAGRPPAAGSAVGGTVISIVAGSTAGALVVHDHLREGDGEADHDHLDARRRAPRPSRSGRS